MTVSERIQMHWSGRFYIDIPATIEACEKALEWLDLLTHQILFYDTRMPEFMHNAGEWERNHTSTSNRKE